MENLNILERGFEALLAAKGLYDSYGKSLIHLIGFSNDQFLNYDPGFLLNIYAQEPPIANGIPYTNCCDFCDLVSPANEWDDSHIRISIGSDFARTHGNDLWQIASSAGFTALRASGRIEQNDPAIRVSSAAVLNNSLYLSFEKAQYYDQAHSNLVLDFDNNDPVSVKSLRTLLSAQYDSKLPPLNDPRMANTLGLACLLFYPEKKNWTPYLVRRVRKLGVFPGVLVQRELEFPLSRVSVLKW